jgi:polygalacturonase
LRPQLIHPIDCTDVLLEGFTINQAGPLNSIQLTYCQNVTVRQLRIDAPQGPNADGIAIDSSTQVLVEDCDLRTGGDCIALKSGLNEDGWRVGRPTENVIIQRVHTTGGCAALAVGSEMSGDIRNVLVRDCQFDAPVTGIRLKSARGRGGVVENIIVEHVKMKNVDGDAIELTAHYPTFATAGGKSPTFRRILFRDLTCRGAKSAVAMTGLPDSHLQDITLERISIAADEGLSCTAASRLHLVDVRITPRDGAALLLKDSQDVLIDGMNNPDPANVFLDLRGRQTRNIRLRPGGDKAARPTIQIGVDVPRDALVHE